MAPAHRYGPGVTGTRADEGNGGTDEGTGGADEAGVAVAAAQLLSHWWSRPVAQEAAAWHAAAPVELALRSVLPVPGEVGHLARRGGDGHLLDEYERLFVGPGPVPCPPYESFWREDVPIDVRRSLMGPCTAELRHLYGELGLQMAPEGSEMPDHIAVELEALAYGLSSPQRHPAALVIWSGHLRRWLPRLCRAVAHEAEVAFYRELAQLTLAWSTALHQLLEPLSASRADVT